MVELVQRADKYFEKFLFLEEIGRGSYGSVYKVYDKNTGRVFALKEVCFDSERMIDEVLKERGPPIQHKNILTYMPLIASERPKEIDRIRRSSMMSQPLEETFNSQTVYQRLRDHEISFLPRESKCRKLYLYLRTSLCDFSLRDFIDFRNKYFFRGKEENDSLRKILEGNENAKIVFENEYGMSIRMPLLSYTSSMRLLKDSLVVNRYFFFFLFRCIINGLVYLHSVGIYHRDIKPSNILLENNGHYVPKISDFGLMKWASDSSVFEKSSDSEDEDGNTAAEDLRAAGVMYYEMLWPFRTTMERAFVIKDLLTNSKLPLEFSRMFEPEARIIEACLNAKGTKSDPARVIQKMLSKVWLLE